MEANIEKNPDLLCNSQLQNNGANESDIKYY